MQVNRDDKSERALRKADAVVSGAREVVGVHIDDRMIEDGMVDIVKMQTLARCGYMDYTPLEKVTSLTRPTWP